jgi:hypothetical protein
MIPNQEGLALVTIRNEIKSLSHPTRNAAAGTASLTSVCCTIPCSHHTKWDRNGG